MVHEKADLRSCFCDVSRTSSMVGGGVTHEGGERVFKPAWPLGILIPLPPPANAKPAFSRAIHCLFLKSLHPCFHHEILRVGNVAPSSPLEFRGLRCGGPRDYPGEAGSCEEEPCRCLRRSGFGRTTCSSRYVISHRFHNPRNLTTSDSAGRNIVAGHLNLCLCLSLLPGFLDSHPVARKVVDGVGRDGARDYFAGLVSGSSFTILQPHDS